jgi:hypothetical protein
MTWLGKAFSVNTMSGGGHQARSPKPRRFMRCLLAGGLLAAAVPAFAGPYDEPGIPATDPAFVAWASGVELVRGPIDIAAPEGPVASFGTPAAALGVANNGPVSLGDGGSATLTFDLPIRNGDGPDFAVFENGFGAGGGLFAELAFVEVSSNGVDFVRFPPVSLTPTDAQVGGFGVLNPSDLRNLAGKHPARQGTPFDLAELVAIAPDLDVNAISAVRIVDVVGRISAVGDYVPVTDSLGNPVNDPYPTPFSSSGFDLDAVGAIHVLPEPATIGLLAVGGLLLLRRRGTTVAGRRLAERDASWQVRSGLGSTMVIAVIALAVPTFASDPWADRVVTEHDGMPLTFGPFHSSPLWSDPEAILGKVNTLDRDDTNWSSPTFREIHLAWGAWYNGTNDPMLAGQPYDAGMATNNGAGLQQGSQIVVAFDEPIVNNPDDGGAHNWGVDFIVHGNAFFSTDEGTTFPDSNMETYHISAGGPVFAEPVTVSVAQALDGPWYTFDTPTADGYFPTQPWAWDWNNHDWSSQELDWTKPVNPTLTGADFGGLSVAEAINLYGGSAGGTGFDLDVFGLDWIQYVMVSDPNGNNGEIAGIVDVAVPEPSSLLLMLPLAVWFGRRR